MPTGFHEAVEEIIHADPAVRQLATDIDEVKERFFLINTNEERQFLQQKLSRLRFEMRQRTNEIIFECKQKVTQYR